jgi:PAS domain S-box-containing protein
VTGRRKDGTTVAIEFCSRAIPHGGNRINLTLFRRLNHEIQNAAQSSAANDHLDQFFEYAPDAYYLADTTGTFTDVNKAAQELFGHKKEFIIGKSFLKLKILAPDQIHKAARHLALNIFGKPTEPEEYVIQRKDGHQIPIEISTRPIKVNDKSLLFGIVRDITEKKKTEKALQRAVKEIESLVEERGSDTKASKQKPKKKAVKG